MSLLVGKESSKARGAPREDLCSDVHLDQVEVKHPEQFTGMCVTVRNYFFPYAVSRAETAHLSHLSPFSKSATSDPSVGSPPA